MAPHPEIAEQRFLEALRLWSPAAQDSYYAPKLSAQEALTINERRVAGEILLRYPRETTHICEIGAGYGQFTFLLAALGYTVRAIEGDSTRAAGAEFICAKMPLNIAAHTTIVHGWYPATCDAGDAKLLITHNVVNSWWEGWQTKNKYVQFIGDRHLILDARVWFQIRESSQDQQALVQSILAAGYEVIRLFSTYYLIKPAQPP